MISAFLRKLFEVADSNKDGVLQHGEFADLLQRSGSFIGLITLIMVLSLAYPDNDLMQLWLRIPL